jgi:hypothetical protein
MLLEQCSLDDVHFGSLWPLSNPGKRFRISDSTFATAIRCCGEHGPSNASLTHRPTRRRGGKTDWNRGFASEKDSWGTDPKSWRHAIQPPMTWALLIEGLAASRAPPKLTVSARDRATDGIWSIARNRTSRSVTNRESGKRIRFSHISWFLMRK